MSKIWTKSKFWRVRRVTFKFQTKVFGFWIITVYQGLNVITSSPSTESPTTRLRLAALAGGASLGGGGRIPSLQHGVVDVEENDDVEFDTERQFVDGFGLRLSAPSSRFNFGSRSRLSFERWASTASRLNLVLSSSSFDLSSSSFDCSRWWTAPTCSNPSTKAGAVNVKSV